MAWTPVVTSGDSVSTPQGTGRIRRVSKNGTAQVEVDGQLFEVPMEQITKLEGEGKPMPSPGEREGEKMPEKPARPVRPWRVKPGDRVQPKDGTRQGTVTEVTQRTIKGKFDNGRKFSVPKKDAANHLDEAQGEKPEEKKQPEQQPEKQESQAKDTVADTADGLHQILQLKEHLEKKIDADVEGELKELREKVKQTQKLEVKVGDKVNVVEGLKHKQLKQLITYAAMRLSPLLVGMAGTGKTHAGEQVAVALGLPFYSMSVGAQTSKSDIIGYMDASGRYVRTHFREAYENGGVFLMDEVDAGNANVLIQINAALSNGLCAFPDSMVQRHEDFVFIASANTFGNGANRQYVGRNQLDAATLDRFAIIEWYIDEDLEEQLAVGLNGKAWYMAVRAARDYVAEKNIRALISPRATQKGSKLLNVGQGVQEVIGATLLGSVPDDKKADVTEVATRIFEKFASEVPSGLPKDVNPEVSDLVRS